MSVEINLRPASKAHDRLFNTATLHVANRLRLRRTVLGWSQAKLATRIGVTFQQIQKYENGTNRVSAGCLFEISRVLGVPVTYFFEGLDHTSEVESKGGSLPDLRGALENREILELVRAFISIVNPETRKTFLEFIKAVGGSWN